MPNFPVIGFNMLKVEATKLVKNVENPTEHGSLPGTIVSATARVRLTSDKHGCVEKCIGLAYAVSLDVAVRVTCSARWHLQSKNLWFLGVFHDWQVGAQKTDSTLGGVSKRSFAGGMYRLSRCI